MNCGIVYIELNFVYFLTKPQSCHDIIIHIVIGPVAPRALM